MVRQTQHIRTTLSLATLTNANFSLTPFDRITGERGLVRVRLTTPSASGGTQLVTISIGIQNPVLNWAVPSEEFVGAGPNLRQPSLEVPGLRGDFIRINVNNPTGGTVVTTLMYELMNLGR